MLQAALRVAVPVVTLAGLGAVVALVSDASPGGAGTQSAAARPGTGVVSNQILLADQRVSAAGPGADVGAGLVLADSADPSAAPAAARRAADQASVAAGAQARLALAQQARDRAAQQARSEATRSAARDPRSLARVILAERGWGSGQFSCLDALWQKESGWNPQARNPSSGAGGIPQALPASKMSAAGADWRTNPATQIAWGLGYIATTYGTPCAAWGHSQAVNWY